MGTISLGVGLAKCVFPTCERDAGIGCGGSVSGVGIVRMLRYHALLGDGMQ